MHALREVNRPASTDQFFQTSNDDHAAKRLTLFGRERSERNFFDCIRRIVRPNHRLVNTQKKVARDAVVQIGCRRYDRGNPGGEKCSRNVGNTVDRPRLQSAARGQNDDARFREGKRRDFIGVKSILSC